MKSLTDILNESRTDNRQITAYVCSWLKQPMNDKEMYDVIGAIVKGCRDAYDYRTDPEYFDESDKKYNQASDALKTLIDQMK